MAKHIIKHLILSFFIASIPAYATVMDDNTHQLALSSAKAGNYARAISLIKPLADKHPKPNRFFYDYIAILGWSGQHQRVVSLSNTISLLNSPLYVLKTLAIAQRDQRQFTEAKKTYQQIVSRFPKSLDSKIGLNLVLIDQQNYSSAKHQLHQLLQQHPRNMEVLYALAYLHESQRHYLQALPVYEKILAIKPTDRFIQKNKILALNKLGASHLARSLIQNNTLLTATELASIRANMAAHRIRWGEVPALNEAKRYVETDIAINDIQQNINNNTQLFGATHPITLNGRFDLLVAMRNRYLMADVIKHYEQLIADKVEVPNYSKNAYCDALLYSRQALNAQHCYRDILARGHQNINTKIALFYALLENENIPEAQQWIEKVAAEQPLVIKGVGKRKVHKGNPQKTLTETVNALSIAFADDLDTALQRFSTLHGAAAYNTNLRKELANIYYWRGWPRKAQEEYLIGLHQEPKHTGLRLGQARNWLALKEYRLAEQSINELFNIFPEDTGIAKQKKLWDIHNFREFKTDISSNKSNGGTNGSRGFAIDSYLYSTPLDYHYRAFIHQRHSQVDFTEGDGLLNHAGIGLEYTAPNILLKGELHHNRFDNNRVGISLSGEYEFTDQISTSFALETLSNSTPLRALNQGIYAKSASLATQYRWHESRSAGATIAYSSFSDGNKRKSLSGFWNERWYNQYNYKFSTRVDLFSSSNSKNNTIYFNPKRDYSASIAFENDFLTWRTYEHSFHQRLVFSTGLYKQKNVSNGDILSAQYEHRWQADNRLELIYGITRSKNLYDGNHELGWNYYLTLDWRF